VVQIHDDGLVEAANLGCNFFTKETDIGVKTRADASLPQLKELNPYCTVEVHKGAITDEVLANFDVVVITDNFNLKEAVQISKICRAHNKGFIFSGLLGLYGFTFVDFGQSHQVFDLDGV
jgi:ubiquitin-activating enzyme E1